MLDDIFSGLPTVEVESLASGDIVTPPHHIPDLSLPALENRHRRTWAFTSFSHDELKGTNRLKKLEALYRITPGALYHHGIGFQTDNAASSCGDSFPGALQCIQFTAF